MQLIVDALKSLLYSSARHRDIPRHTHTHTPTPMKLLLELTICLILGALLVTAPIALRAILKTLEVL